jgi:low temperature requirement protein LtrA
LIVIIAIGESIVAVGVGAAGLPLDAGRVTAALLGVAVAAGLWWTYFDWVSIVTERVLGRVTGAAQAALARDIYSYLHLPMVAGVVLFALAMKKTLANFGDPLDTVPAAGLCGGLALYLLAHVLVRYRTSLVFGRRSIGHGRPAAVVALLALFPLALELPALASLAAVTAVMVGLIAYEAIRYRQPRAQIRQGVDPTPEMMSAR